MICVKDSRLGKYSVQKAWGLRRGQPWLAGSGPLERHPESSLDCFLSGNYPEASTLHRLIIDRSVGSHKTRES